MRYLNIKHRKFALLLMLVVALVMSMTAAAQDVVTIEWWTVDSEEFDEAAQRALVDQFNAEHPNIQVNMTVLPSDGFDERMTTTLGAGQGAPDVAFFWNTNWYPQALDLTPFLEADPDLGPETYLEGFWQTRSVWQDKVIGLPLGVGANFVMYNKDVFDAAGVEYPSADWTPDDFIAIATQLTNPDTRVWGGDRPRGPFRAIWRNFGATVYSDDSTTVDGYLNSPESVTAYSWLIDLVNSGVTPTPADIEILGTEGTGPYDLFVAGRVAMATLNQGHMLNAAREGINFGVVPEPGIPDNDPYVNAWSLTASVWAGTEHPQEAYEWLSYWAGPEGQQFLMENANLIPSIPSVLESFPYADQEYAQQFFEILNHNQVAAWDNDHPCWRGAVIRAQQDIWDLINLGEMDPDGIQPALDAAVPAAQTALEECVGQLGG